MTLVLPALTWRSSPNYSSRYGQRVRLIVIHDCEGSFGGSVSWFAMAVSQVSAHIVLSADGLQAIQMVAWANKAWHACNFNPFSEGVEAAGYSALGLGAAEWAALAAIVAFRLHVNGIPCQRANAANNWTGYCEHVELGVAGGGHHDITDDPSKQAAFDALVRAAFAQDMPATWGMAAIPAMVPSASAGWKPIGTVRHDLAPPSLEWAQMRLNALGVPVVPLTVDGLDGRNTQNAVVRFQQSRGLYVDGDIGPDTIKALEAAS